MHQNDEKIIPFFNKVCKDFPWGCVWPHKNPLRACWGSGLQMDRVGFGYVLGAMGFGNSR